MTETITACPECDSPNIKPRNPDKPSSPPAQTTNWYCNACGAQFDEARERPRHINPGGRSGLAGKLARADPDVLPDGGEEIVYVRSQATGSGIDVYHTDRQCNTLQQATQIIERERRHVPADATECKHCQGVLGGGETHEPDWEPQRVLREAEPGDFVTDGGGSYCAACHRAVAREDRIEVGGEVYHRLCAPDGGGSYCAACHRAVAREDRIEVGGEVYHRSCAPDEATANRQFDEFVPDGAGPPATCTNCGVEFPPEGACPSGGGHDFVAFDGGRPVHHGVCRDCPDEWVGTAQSVHREAEIHSLAHGHRTEVAQVSGGERR